MAFSVHVGSFWRTYKSIYTQPLFIVSSNSSIIQKRYAARKGYREKARLLKKKQKLEKIEPVKVPFGIKKIKIVKTVDREKPDVPDDDIFIESDFKYKKYSIVEAVNFHKEYHDPTLFNNPTANITLRLEFDMTANDKGTKFMKSFTGVASIPNPFNYGGKREVLVFCKPEHVEEALETGASVAGGTDIMKKIKEGSISLAIFDYILCHKDFYPDITPVRSILKEKLPRLSHGTLTTNVKEAVYRFKNGIEYSCRKGSEQNFGIVDCPIGSISMKSEHIEENFIALLQDLQKFRPKRKGDFISWVWCKSPPSVEQFAIDWSMYKKDVEQAIVEKNTEIIEEEENIEKEIENEEEKEISKQN